VLSTVVRTVSVTAAKAGAKAHHPGPRGRSWRGMDRGRLRAALCEGGARRVADGEPRWSVQRKIVAELGVKPGENAAACASPENIVSSKGTMEIFCRDACSNHAWSFSASAGRAVVRRSASAAAWLSVNRLRTAGQLWGIPPMRDMLIDGYALGKSRGRRFCRGIDPGKGGDEAALRTAVATGPPPLSRFRRQPSQNGGAAEK